jgi:hypothetical protein
MSKLGIILNWKYQKPSKGSYKGLKKLLKYGSYRESPDHRQRRSLTKARVREAVERYLEVLAEEIASGEWVDVPGIGKVQVSHVGGKGYVTSITPGGQRVRRKVQTRLRTRIRLYERLKRHCRQRS